MVLTPAGPDPAIFIAGRKQKRRGDRAICLIGASTEVFVSFACRGHTGRFYDFLEKRDGRWGIVLRQPIYEKDRMDPISPSAKLDLDQSLLERFPEGYRHLAYMQTRIGYTVKPDMPGLKGPEVERLYRRGEAWLAGDGL
jgi:hypothetical protein